MTMQALTLDGLDPGRVAAALALPVSAATRGRLLATERLASRLLGLIAEHEGLVPWQDTLIDPAQAWLMRLDQGGMRQAGLAAGALWHARSLRAMIMARPRAELLEALGETIYGFAVAHVELAAEETVIAEPEALLDAIRRDGTRCLAAWGEVLPAEAVPWFRLKLPADAPLPEERHRVHGLVVIACIRDALLTAEDTP
jgi:hypothetical protein